MLLQRIEAQLGLEKACSSNIISAVTKITGMQVCGIPGGKEVFLEQVISRFK